MAMAPRFIPSIIASVNADVDTSGDIQCNNTLKWCSLHEDGTQFQKRRLTVFGQFSTPLILRVSDYRYMILQYKMVKVQ